MTTPYPRWGQPALPLCSVTSCVQTQGPDEPTSMSTMPRRKPKPEPDPDRPRLPMNRPFMPDLDPPRLPPDVSVKACQATIGRTALWSPIDGVEMQVRIMDARSKYGRMHCLIEPVIGGLGQGWVWRDKLSLIGPDPS